MVEALRLRMDLEGEDKVCSEVLLFRMGLEAGGGACSESGLLELLLLVTTSSPPDFSIKPRSIKANQLITIQ